jgi:outer membrane immunogenic protein
MKKVLLASAALAAQIASPALAAEWPVIAPTYEVAPPPPPPAIYSWWTGCYLGGNVGGAWGRPHYTHDDSEVVENFEFTPVGVIGGGQFGCQYQWNSLVFGLEGTYSWSNVQQQQQGTVPEPGNRLELANRDRLIEISQIATVTARLGYAWDRTMLYAKGGWAGVRISARASCLSPISSSPCAAGIAPGTLTFSDFTDWSNGWTVGVGLEHVPWQNIVLGVEANVYGGLTFDHAGRDNVGNPIRFFNSDAKIYAITVRASYLFGPPIVTRYVN